MASLFALGDELRAASARMDDSVDESTGEIGADATAEFDAIDAALDTKLMDWMRWYKNELAHAANCKAESKKMAANAKAAEAKAKWIAGGIDAHLAEGHTLKDGTGKLSRQKNPDKVEVFGVVGEKYRRQPALPAWEPDKVALLRDLKAGVEEASEGARLEPGTMRLVIA